MGHFGLLWVRVPDPATGDWVRLPQGIGGSPEAFTIMLGDRAWVFNLLATYLAIMSLAATAYIVQPLKFALKPMRRCETWLLGRTALSRCSTWSPPTRTSSRRLEFAGGENTDIPLGAMYPWKYIGLIGMMVVGFVVSMYLKASATGSTGAGRAAEPPVRFMICATVIITMVTMGHARRLWRVDYQPKVFDLQLYHVAAERRQRELSAGSRNDAPAR